MKIWLPYVAAGTGADVSTTQLARALNGLGHHAHAQPFPHLCELAPWLLGAVRPPRDCDITVTNTWNGFAFRRQGIPMVAVDRLFVLDPALAAYKSPAQRWYHQHLVRRFVRASAARADATVAVSRYTAEVLSEQLRLPRPRVILNAVDTTFFSPDAVPRRPVSDRPCRLLFVGKLSRRKGADLLPQILRRLGSGFELHYTGTADARALGAAIPSNLHALGRLSLLQTRDQYRQADLLLFPSRAEGLSRAVMEALACGTPVVAANTSSLPEAVDDEVGRLCPVDDADAFADAIARICADRDRLEQLGANARVRALARFDLRRMAGEYLDLFEELLAGNGARTPAR